MKIVADQAIPYVRRYFASLGDVTLLDVRDITTDSIKDADCLVLRSVTRIDRKLLDGTQVRCIASASSGTDHVDTDYLATRDIPLFDAKGCNANSVAEFVLSCLFVLSEQYGVELEGRTAGIIGCGNVGARLRHLLHAIGFETRVYDPFIRDEHNAYPFQDLAHVLSSDIISLHVPYTSTGEYPTAQMVGRDFLGRLRRDVIFINSARGRVVNERALIDFARENQSSRLVLDVWAGEPEINDELFRLATLATPHIAGYSSRAKLNATRLVYEKLCKWFDMPALADTVISLPAGNAEIKLSGFNREFEAIRTAVLAAYDVRSDCAALREIESIDPEVRGDFFTSLRADYPFRREFAELQVILPEQPGLVRPRLSALGFTVKT